MKRSFFSWTPSIDTVVVALSILALTFLAYLGLNVFGKTFLNPIIFGFLGTLCVCVIFPLYWALRVRKESLESLGITKNRWLISLIVGIVLGALSFLSYYKNFGFDPVILPALVVGLYAFWEVFFVYGWSQLWFEKAFGIVPAIILAGVNFAVYHMAYGWFTSSDYISFLIIGIILGIIFRFTKNILILWPFLWPVSSLQGFAKGNFSPDWKIAGSSAFLLVIMLIAIYVFYRKRVTIKVPLTNETKGTTPQV